MLQRHWFCCFCSVSVDIKVHVFYTSHTFSSPNECHQTSPSICCCSGYSVKWQSQLRPTSTPAFDWGVSSHTGCHGQTPRAQPTRRGWRHERLLSVGHVTTSLKSRHIGPEMLRGRLQLVFVVQTASVAGAWQPHVITRVVHAMLVAKHKAKLLLFGSIPLYLILPCLCQLTRQRVFERGEEKKNFVTADKRRQTWRSGIETRSCRALTQVFSALGNIADAALKLCKVPTNTVIVPPEEAPAPFLTSQSDAFLD